MPDKVEAAPTPGTKEAILAMVKDMNDSAIELAADIRENLPDHDQSWLSRGIMDVQTGLLEVVKSISNR